MQLDLEDSSLTSQLSSLILLGEGDVHVELLTGGVANDLILEAGDERAAAQGQVVVLSLAALKSDTVHKALEVDINDIAILSSTLTGQLTGVALLHALQLCIDGLVGNSMDSLLNGQTVVVADLDFGHHSDLDGQGHALGLAGSIHRNLGTANGLDAGFLHSCLVSSGEQLIDGIIGKDISAVHLLDQRTGSLALAEAGHGVLLALLLENIGHCALKGLSVDRELQLCHALLELFALDEIHFVYPPLKNSIALGTGFLPCLLQPRTASCIFCLRNAGTRALNWVQQSRQNLL